MQLSEKELIRISHYMKNNFGIHLTDKKRTLIETRLQTMMQKRAFDNFGAYFDVVMNDPTGQEASQLLNFLTTNHTYFMREKEHFDFFETTILPELFESNGHTRNFRIWSAGCSSGQEPYSLMMLTHEYMNRQNIVQYNWDYQMLATDISDRALEKAIHGHYAQSEVADVPKVLLQKHFTKVENGYVVKPDLQKQILFRKFNLMNPAFPFKQKFHVIFCRNVMIYFDSETKENLVQKFYNHLEPGGYLLIGHSEFIDKSKIPFQYIQPAIYKK